MPPVLPRPAKNCPSSSLPLSIQPSSVSHRPVRLPLPTPACLPLLRSRAGPFVTSGVCGGNPAAGAGAGIPPRGPERLPRPRMQTGKPSQGPPPRKRAGYFIHFSKCVQNLVYLIGIMRRSQRRGRLSPITAADARDGRPKSCQGRTAAGEAADAAKNRPKKLEFCRVS